MSLNYRINPKQGAMPPERFTMKKYNFIKEYKNGMKIEKKESTYINPNGYIGYDFIVWHNGTPIKCYSTEKTAVNYIETF